MIPSGIMIGMTLSSSILNFGTQKLMDLTLIKTMYSLSRKLKNIDLLETTYLSTYVVLMGMLSKWSPTNASNLTNQNATADEVRGMLEKLATSSRS